MEKFATSSFRLGIAGGGQLGRMLALSATNWDITTHCLDKNEKAPARIICEKVHNGSLTDYDDVVAFGQNVDLITVESDNVNADALEYLEKQGKKVAPSSSILRIIQDKGLQREFCTEHQLPNPKYKVYSSKDELLKDNSLEFPCIIKTRKAGYDGKGVFLVQDASELPELPEVPLLMEEKVNIKKELAVIVVRNRDNQLETYPLIELFMKSDAYMVDYLVSPSKVDEKIQRKAQYISKKLAEALKIEGVLAVELFLTDNDEIIINECSPRPHNSGHHTIEASFTSQYENHLRGVLNLPLGNCDSKVHAAMINVLGDPEASGPVKYKNLTECLSVRGAKVHIYGKETVAPNRKMGHITILNESYDDLLKDVEKLKTKVKVVS